MSSSDSDKNYQRNKPKSGNTVDNEVKRLMRKGKGILNPNEFLRLRNKYDDQSLVDKIQQAYMEQHENVVKKAKKFASLIKQKYSNTNYPFHTLLEKAYKYKHKHNLTDEQFVEFQRIYEQELVGQGNSDVVIPNTNMMKVLGNITTDNMGYNFKVSDKDYRSLQELLKLYETSRPRHAQVMLQSMQYKDSDFEALTGSYNRDRHQPHQHIHPVIAALFLPKIDTLEHHFLFSNIAGIVKSRYNKEPLRTRPDYELFYSLVTDPNDIVCDNRSPIQDLLARANLQNQLWNSVLHLRNGQYYNSSFSEFVTSIHMCRLNKYDTPDLIYGRYDGTIIKRLLSSFSFRPTVVATMPVFKMFSTNPYHQNVKPTVTSVQMINLRLPPVLNDNAAVDLKDALEQHQLFMDSNGAVVPRSTSLIYSRGVLFFFVDRRSHVMKVGKFQPFNIARLPVAVSGFERLNEREVNFETEFTIRGDVYQLRSVVLSELNKNVVPQQNIVIGSSAAFMVHADPEGGRVKPEYYHYDPAGVSDSQFDKVGGAYVQNKPVTMLHGTPGSGAKGFSFTEMARTRGTIFMYQNVKDATQGLIAY